MKGTQVGRISFKCLPAWRTTLLCKLFTRSSFHISSSLRKGLSSHHRNTQPLDRSFLLSPHTHPVLHLLTLDRAGLGRAEGSHCCAMNPLRRVTAERQVLRPPSARDFSSGGEAGFYRKPHRTGAKGRVGKAGASGSARRDGDPLSLLFTRLLIPSPGR